jgi:hypothetical protein
MKTRWITHKDKKILLVDLSNLGFDVKNAQTEMETAIALASQEPLDSVLTLTDVRGTKLSPDLFDHMQFTANQIAPYAVRRAILGVSEPDHLLLDLFNKLPLQSGSKQFISFDDPETAKEWLVSG